MTPKTTLSEQPTLPIDLGPSTSDRPEEPEETEERFGNRSAQKNTVYLHLRFLE